MGRKQKPWGYDSRGIPFSVFCLPALLFFVVLLAIPILAPDLIERCVGRPIDPPKGKASIVYVALELACSPLLLFGSMTEITLFVLILTALIMAALAWLWIRKHQAYWDVIRAKEKERRKQKRIQKEQQKQK